MKQPDLTLIEGGRPDVAPGEFAFDYDEVGDRGRRTKHRGLPLADVLDVAFEDCAPVRPFDAYPTQSHYPGWWWTATNRRHVGFESWNERDHLCLLDFDPTVTGISSQPFLVYGHDDQGEWSHWPDYFCRLYDGTVRLVDVTTDRKFTTGRIARQRKRTERLCDELGWDYKMVVEPEELRIANVKWLAGYRRPIADPHDFARALLDACDKPTPVHDLADQVGPRLLVLPQVFHLCWQMRLSIDLNRPLRTYSLVRPVEGASA